MVVKRGMNEGEIVPMAEQFRGTGHILRYIEFMDVGTTNGWRLDDVFTARDIAAEIDAVHPIEPMDPNYHGEVAKRWRYLDGSGEVRIISSVSPAFLWCVLESTSICRRADLHMLVRQSRRGFSRACTDGPFGGGTHRKSCGFVARS